MPRFNPVLDQLPTYPFVELDRRKAALRAEGRPVYDFSMGDPVEPTPEFIRQALLGSVEASCPYPSVSGRPPVRSAISAYLQRRFGVQADPNTSILPTAGSKEAVFHAPLLVIDPHAPDRLVVFPDPGYPAYERGARFAGGIPHPVALHGDHRFRPWELPEGVLAQTRLLWINNPHNPSGAVSPLEDLERTAELCRAHDILLIADETYADIYDEGAEPPHSLLECGFEGLLVLHSLSKRSGMTGYRSGFLAGDPNLIRRLRDLRSNPGLAPQDFVNAAAAVAWEDDAHVAERRRLFNTKKQILTAFFESAGLEVVEGGATIYLWVRCPQGYDGTSWAHHLLSQGIVVTPGALLGITEAGAPYVRVALVPSPEECQAAVDAWRTLV